MDASSVPAPGPVKSLSERVAYGKPQQSQKSAPLTKTSANPKAQPKSATAKKATDNKNAKGKPGKQRKARPATRKPKTAEELDAEMTDYWGGNGTANGATTEVVAAASTLGATAATGDDMGMEEISVSSQKFVISHVKMLTVIQ